MKSLRIPLGVWNWRGTALVLVLLLAPLLATLTLVPDGDVVAIALGAHSVVVGAATLAASVFLYLHWRITASSATSWLALLLAGAAVLVQAPALPAPPVLEVVRVVVPAAITVVLAVTVSRLDDLPRWVGTRVAVGLLLLGLGSTVDGATALVTGLVGAVLLAGTAAVALHQAIDEEKREVADLHQRLDAVELGLREDRARLHEIDATVAGIASAQALLHDGLSPDRSHALAAMMHAEVERLARLVADRAPATRRNIDLDEVVGQIVTAHLARGRRILWEPSGLRAIGRGDDIAEIVNVLLDNAAVHGGPHPISVDVVSDSTGSGVTVTVSDHGPGVPAELSHLIFQWGTSRPGSPGQGIGLHVAADIAHRMGGRLELLPTGPGASFALHLPAAPREVSADGRIARAS